MRTIEWIEARCEKITETGCWIWMGSTMSGYGCFRDKFNESTKAAHRTVLANLIGPLPDGVWALHRCDITECCNPHHIFAGTRHDNIADAVAKGRLKGVSRNRPSGLKYNWTKKPGPKGKRHEDS